MKLTPSFYLTSDTHFFHSAMLRLSHRPENYEDLIVENWNKVVKKHDKILHLGDLSLGSKEKTVAICKKLKGRKYLLKGNHDSGSETWYNDCGFEVVERIYKPFKNKYGDLIRVIFTHEPVLEIPDDWFNIHGHLHSCKPQEDDDNHRGFFLNKQYYDVGVDAHNFRLVPLYEILNKFFEEAKL